MRPIPQCEVCDAPFPDARAELKYTTCLPCGEKAARRERIRKASMCIPINKSTPTYISDHTLLRGLNKYANG